VKSVLLPETVARNYAAVKRPTSAREYVEIFIAIQLEAEVSPKTILSHYV